MSSSTLQAAVPNTPDSAAASPESAEDGFAELGLHPALLRSLRGLGFEAPTPIQRESIPAALEGRDLLATAMTGSGKTAAFLLPILQRILTTPGEGHRALILSPTRELAAQITEHLEGIAKGTRIRGVAVFGGVNPRPQERAFREGAEVLVATPGRLLDHLSQGTARLGGVEMLVLDEADRMLDMGFVPEVRRILRHLGTGRRQTMLFSATMPPPIEELSKEMLRDPVRVQVQRRAAPPAALDQALYPVRQDRKVDLLAHLLRTEDMKSAIVFCRTKHRAKRLAKKLAALGFGAAEIHGNRSQNQRRDALEGFRSGRYRVLVATDIVARGIDVEELRHVVNFDVPVQAEDYIHRIGRTARAEASGEAWTFVSPDEEKGVRQIEQALGRRLPRRVVPGFDTPPADDEPLEIPLAERLRAHRAGRALSRGRRAR